MNDEITLLNCDKEPIHIPGRIQSHGFIVISSPDTLRVDQISENVVSFLGEEYSSYLGKELGIILSNQTITSIKNFIAKQDFSLFNPQKITIKTKEQEKTFNLICSLSNNILILEFEPFIENEQSTDSYFYYSFNTALTKIQATKNLDELFEVTAEQVKQLIDYDRVMIYRFDKDWHGEVVGEARNENIEPFFGLHYPHTDIPAQARELYLRNWIRLITDVNSPQPLIHPTLNPNTNKPVDLSDTILRATSPIHIEYLKNMGVVGTLTISIIFKGKLWGLFACHNYSPKFISYNLRITCELIGKVFSNHLDYKQADHDNKYRDLIKSNNASIIEKMSEKWNIVDGLIKSTTNILNLNEASGAALYYDEEVYLLGQTPSNDQIKVIAEYLNKTSENLIVTNELSTIVPEAINFKDKASGLMAVKISENEYVMWFKPEVIQTVNWGGKPDEKNIVVEDNKVRLSPRKSFEKWSQVVENKSTEWKDSEIEVAEQLRENIINIVLKNSTQLKKLNKELKYQRDALASKNDELLNFAYIASHDLKEPLRMIISYNQLLLKKYKDQLDEGAIDFIQYSVDGGNRMKVLIESLLQYAKIGYDSNDFTDVNINEVVGNCLANLSFAIKEKDVKIEIDNMPTIKGDKILLILLFQNLVGNAIKYGSKNSPKIKISFKELKEEYCFCISDNGIGIEEKEFENIFAMFKRLHSKSEFEGTGIGLATCKKIVEYHKGNIWVESDPGKGSQFYFTIKKDLDE